MTTAFLALLPRVHVTMLVWMIFVFTFQVPAMILIVFKMILWDNIISPEIEGGAAASNVAFSAHLGGYAFGFAVAMGLLALRILPRNQFDMLALWDRWRRRSGIEVPFAQSAPYMARPVRAEELDSRPLADVPLTPIESLREEIADRLAAHDVSGAVGSYLRLLSLDEQQVLARPQQLEIANCLAQARRYREAAAAYEAFLAAYPGAATSRRSGCSWACSTAGTWVSMNAPSRSSARRWRHSTSTPNARSPKRSYGSRKPGCSVATRARDNAVKFRILMGWPGLAQHGRGT